MAVVTGTRAESGLLETVMHAIDAHPALRLSVVAAGMHLITGTWRELPFKPAAKVAMQRKGQGGRLADAAALGRGISGFAKVFDDLSPGFVLVLGDRIEAFAAASAGSVGGCRVAHMHGGDRAEGVADEAMRHAITKLAHLHLPATAQSRRRILRLGEDPAAVFNVGSPAVDGLADIPPAAPSLAPNVIVMHHPVGDPPAVERQRMARILAATRGFGRRLILLPNHDPGREGIVAAIDAEKRGADDEVLAHLPRRDFVSRLKAASMLIGNSSAGLIEAAVCRTPAVNVGTRQAGREAPANVVSCADDPASMTQAIRAAATLDRTKLRHPYGPGRTGQTVAELLAEIDPAALPLRKRNCY